MIQHPIPVSCAAIVVEMKRPSVRTGFTLVELLVTISIIGLLLAILMPVLGGGRDAAQRVTCLSNLKQEGIAIVTYATDSNDLFPYHEFWYNHSGRKGNLAMFGIAPFPPVDQTGIQGEAGILAERPLNEYLNESAAASSCPADLGDSKKPTVTSCYVAYGTSFQIQWNDGGATPYPAFGAVPVTGYATLNAGGGRTIYPQWPAARINCPIPFAGQTYTGHWSRKILMGDLNWQGNRPITDPRVLWHRPTDKGVRQQNMAFGDGHAEFFVFPPTYGPSMLPVDEGVNGFW